MKGVLKFINTQVSFPFLLSHYHIYKRSETETHQLPLALRKEWPETGRICLKHALQCRVIKLIMK